MPIVLAVACLVLGAMACARVALAAKVQLSWLAAADALVNLTAAIILGGIAVQSIVHF